MVKVGLLLYLYQLLTGLYIYISLFLLPQTESRAFETIILFHISYSDEAAQAHYLARINMLIASEMAP